MAEPFQGFLKGADVLLDAVTQASQQGAVCGLGAAGVGAAGDEGQSRSWRSHRSSRVQNLGSPGQEHQRTSRSTFVGGTRCRSKVELLGSVGEVVGQGQGGLEGVAELISGEGKVDAEEYAEVDAGEEVVAQVDVEVDAEEDVEVDVEVEGVKVVLELDGEVAP